MDDTLDTLTVRHVADLLAVKPKTVRDLIRTGRIRATRPAPRSNWTIEPSAVGEYLIIGQHHRGRPRRIDR